MNMAVFMDVYAGGGIWGERGGGHETVWSVYDSTSIKWF